MTWLSHFYYNISFIKLNIYKITTVEKNSKAIKAIYASIHVNSRTVVLYLINGMQM